MRLRGAYQQAAIEEREAFHQLRAVLFSAGLLYAFVVVVGFTMALLWLMPELPL